MFLFVISLVTSSPSRRPPHSPSDNDYDDDNHKMTSHCSGQYLRDRRWKRFIRRRHSSFHSSTTVLLFTTMARRLEASWPSMR